MRGKATASDDDGGEWPEEDEGVPYDDESERDERGEAPPPPPLPRSKGKGKKGKRSPGQRPARKRTAPSRPVAPAVEVTADEPAALRELEVLAATDDAAQEIRIERTGPAEYLGRRVQLAYCGALPASTSRIHEAIHARWGGGHYRLSWLDADGRPRQVVIRLAGRPHAIDEREEADYDAAAAEAAASRMPPAPPYYDDDAPSSFRHIQPSLNLGWLWAPQHQRWMWTGPGEQPLSPEPPPPAAAFRHDPPSELAELKARLEEERRARELRELEARLRAEASPRQDKMAETMAQLFQAQMQMQQATLERDRQEAQRRREDEAKAEERRREREEAQRRDDRERAERWEREQAKMAAQQQQFLTSLVTSQLESAGKRGSLSELLEQAQALKALTEREPDEWEGIERVINVSEKALVNGIGALRGGAQAGGSAAAGGPPALPDNGQALMAAALDFVCAMQAKGWAPRETAAGLVGIAAAHRVPAGAMFAQLRDVTPGNVLEVLDHAITAGNPEERKRYTEDRARLATPEGQRWLAALIAEARKSAPPS